MKLLQGTEKKDHIRADVTGSKEGNLIHVESCGCCNPLRFQEGNPADPCGPLD